VDAGPGTEVVLDALHTVRGELAAFREGLAARPAVVALNKADLLDPAEIETAVAAVAELGWPDAVVAVSAIRGDGLEALTGRMARLVRDVRAGQDRLESFTVAREGGAFRISGAALERLVAKTDLDNEEAVAYLQEVIARAGVDEALRRAGAVPGDTVLVGETTLEFA